jgi:hypothetical protein
VGNIHFPHVGSFAFPMTVKTPVLVGAYEDVDAIAVERYGQARGREDLLEQSGVAVEVFGGTEVQSDDDRGGVVNGPEQGHRRAAVLEPVEWAAVELEQLPTGLLAWAPGAVLGRPPAMDGAEPERAPEAAHGLPRDGHVVELAQFLRQVRVVEAGVPVAQQRLHLGTHGGSEPAMGGPPPALVAQGRGPAHAKALLQPLKLAWGEMQRGGPLPIANPTGQGRLHQPGAGQLLAAHRESLHRGTTVSRSSYPTTFLCSSSTVPGRP